MNKEALIEALKESGRVVLLAILPLLIASVEKGEFDLKAIGVVAGLAFLRFIDKYLHLNEKNGVSGGLTRF